jgi:ABC-type glycerol-3-phosphate transport system permease component
MSFPAQIHLENFSNAWVEGKFSGYMYNSAVAALGTVILVLFTTSLAGYAFARMNFKANQFIFFLIFTGMTIPLTLRMGPLLSLMDKLRLDNSLGGLVLAYTAHNIPFGILLMRSFFRQFPGEIEDAARIDGASKLQLFLRILLPISKPAFSTLGIFTFMTAWSDFVIALFLLNSNSTRTLPLGLLAFQYERSTDYALSIAGITMAALPVIFIYIIFQNSFIEGLTAGVLK